MSYVLQSEYLDFVSGVAVGEDKSRIYVFTHLKNNRIYKKADPIGFVAVHPKTKRLCFQLITNVSMGKKTMMKIAHFLDMMEHKRIEFNEETGELILL